MGVRSSDRGKWQAMRPIGRQERESVVRERNRHAWRDREKNPK